MLTIRIAKITDGRSYTALDGANSTMVFQFDNDTGDDRRVLVVELGPWLRGDIVLEHLSGEEGLLVYERDDAKHDTPLIQRQFPQEGQG